MSGDVMDNKNIDKVVKILKKEYKNNPAPIVTLISNTKRDPFLVLISTLLSLRTKDKTTAKASFALFKIANTPKKILKIPTTKLEKLIYPVGFYKTKAKNIKAVCKIIIEQYKGKVPADLDLLLEMPGVGRKTANLVLTLGYNKLGICVDVHVHVMCNRLAWVHTKTPNETEFALRALLPKKYWIIINDLMVSYGQTICMTAYPKCGRCKIEKYCKYEKKELTRV